MKSKAALLSSCFHVLIGAALMSSSVLALTLMGGASAAVAAAPAHGSVLSAAPPGLSITLSDATTKTQSGATLTYAATVTNAGAAPVKGTLEITIPSYAAYADSGSKNGPDTRWSIAVGAGKSVSKKAIVKIGTIPKGEVRFTTLATLYPAGKSKQILVRTADPDAIRGVVDPAHTVGHQQVSKADSTGPLVLIVTIVGVIILAGIAVLLWTRRRRSGSRMARGPLTGGTKRHDEQPPT